MKNNYFILLFLFVTLAFSYTIRGQSEWGILRIDTVAPSLPTTCTSDCNKLAPNGLAEKDGVLYLSYKDSLKDEAKQVRTLLIKSDDYGVTWSNPIQSINSVYSDSRVDVLDNNGNIMDTIAVWGTIMKNPITEDLTYVLNKVRFEDSDSSKTRRSEITLWNYSPTNDSWTYKSTLDVPKCSNGVITSLTAITDNFMVFPNGDLALSGNTIRFVSGACVDESQYELGSGYFLSTDDGDSWSTLKANFKEVDVSGYLTPNTDDHQFAYYEGNDTNPKLQFSEVTMTSRQTPAGTTLYAYMRPNFNIYSDETYGYGAAYANGSNTVISGLIWHTTSIDSGNTWATPTPLDLGSRTDGSGTVHSIKDLEIRYKTSTSSISAFKIGDLETNLLAYPQAVKINDDEYLMVGGRLNVGNRRLSFYQSSDAVAYNFIGETSYTGLSSIPPAPLLPINDFNTPKLLGGIQEMVELPNGDLYCIYYASVIETDSLPYKDKRVEIYGVTLTKFRQCISGDITLSDPISTDTEHITDGTILGQNNNSITNNSNVIYDADNITLNPGFEVELGSTFKAINIKCIDYGN